MLNRITRGIIIASLLLHPQVNTVEAFAIEYKDTVNDIKVINNINNEDTDICINQGYNNLDLKIEQYKQIQDKVNSRIDNIIRRQEDQARIEEEKKNSYDVEFELTFYSRHPIENGGFNCTSTGTSLREGIVANNMYPIGTKILLEDGREFIVEDRGGKKHFDNYYRLDVFVDTYDVDYVNSLGRQYVKGRIIKE